MLLESTEKCMVEKIGAINATGVVSIVTTYERDQKRIEKTLAETIPTNVVI